MKLEKLASIMFAVGFIVVCLLGLKDQENLQALQDKFDNHIPTKYELQERLLNQGYDLGPDANDGFIGCKDSYTQKAWDLHINIQEGNKAWERHGLE